MLWPQHLPASIKDAAEDLARLGVPSLAAEREAHALQAHERAWMLGAPNASEGVGGLAVELLGLAPAAELGHEPAHVRGEDERFGMFRTKHTP